MGKSCMLLVSSLGLVSFISLEKICYMCLFLLYPRGGGVEVSAHLLRGQFFPLEVKARAFSAGGRCLHPRSCGVAYQSKPRFSRSQVSLSFCSGPWEPVLRDPAGLDLEKK